MTFSTLGITDAIAQVLIEKGYDTPSPIQAEAIPAILAGRDVKAAAQTGTGKTAAFLVPILQRLAEAKTPLRANSVKVLILTPTRELAAQVHESACFYGKNLSLRYAVVFGGVKINPQMMRLRQGADILVATPGRLMDLYSQNAVRFDQVEVFVLDEADRMLDMGFIHDIKKIMKLLPKRLQNLMFSATFSPEISQLAKGFLDNPVQIDVSPRNTTAENIKQVIYSVAKNQKASLLSHLIIDRSWSQVLVFSRTKHGANRIVEKLIRDGITALAIHGNKSQNFRTKALSNFKEGLITVLVATDIAARGLDIAELPHVVNYDLPNVPEDYVHRIGRTGRAGRNGEACSLVSPDESALLRDIQRVIKMTIPVIPNAGFSDLVSAPHVDQQPRARVAHPREPRSGAPRKSVGAGPRTGSQQKPRAAQATSRPRTDNAQSPRRGSTEQRERHKPSGNRGSSVDGNRAPRSHNAGRPGHHKPRKSDTD